MNRFHVAHERFPGIPWQGNLIVLCEVTVGGCARSQQLPVSNQVRNFPSLLRSICSLDVVGFTTLLGVSTVPKEDRIDLACRFYTRAIGVRGWTSLKYARRR
jgi:hypothetical protein